MLSVSFSRKKRRGGPVLTLTDKSEFPVPTRSYLAVPSELSANRKLLVRRNLDE